MTLQEQIRSNRLRTALVLLGFAVLTAALVLVIAGVYDPGVAGFIGIVAIGYGVFSWFFADKIVAAASGAHPISKEQAPELYRAVENAAIGAGLPKTPDVYIIQRRRAECLRRRPQSRPRVRRGHDRPRRQALAA